MPRRAAPAPRRPSRGLGALSGSLEKEASGAGLALCRFGGEVPWNLLGASTFTEFPEVLQRTSWFRVSFEVLITAEIPKGLKRTF